MNNNQSTISDRIKGLPEMPGVYLMRDRTGAVIYVGKAVNLKKRVKSYFQKKELPPKISSLVSNIQRLDYLSANSEQDALVLENTLIKRYQPRYNTLLRDDKTYPYLALLLSEKYPRLLLTRQKKKDGNLYFGPYPFVNQVRGLMAWLVKNFKLRPCKEKFEDTASPAKIKKYEKCLYRHIKKCPAPCMGGISEKDYSNQVNKLKLFLTGKHNNLLNIWKKEMKKASKQLNFETAGELRDRIFALENIYNRVRFKQVKLEDVDSAARQNEVLSSLKNLLGLKKTPLVIESFDISNIAGELPVGSMVSFKNGMPEKSSYRLYKIKTVTGSDDPAMIGEVISRRYSRLKNESRDMPDLILIDGGRSQLNSAVKALELLGLGGLDVISLAKRNEEIYTKSAGKQLLAKDNPALQLLMRVRDETHRFAINFYRKRHSKQMLETSPRG